ncbi:hypothetical protein CHUAL_007538 [Chamberlinius hualienensis]
MMASEKSHSSRRNSFRETNLYALPIYRVSQKKNSVFSVFLSCNINGRSKSQSCSQPLSCYAKEIFAMSTAAEEVSNSKCFGGYQKVFAHYSTELKCKQNFSLYLPPQAELGKVPLLYWLSGLTCTEQNFIIKSGAQKYAAEYGVAIVGPDTSPRGCNIEGEDDDWDFGTGAGFYVDATEEKWKEHYRMYSYVTEELPNVVSSLNLPIIPDKQSIFGHSMGGHGALICALKNPGKYRSVSAFAPISNPIECPWGQKAFKGYLGDDVETWKQYDATHVVRDYHGPPLEILIDQGSDDPYLQNQLMPETFVKACAESRVPVVYRVHEGYDHGFFFISTFIDEHIKNHVNYLTQY